MNSQEFIKKLNQVQELLQHEKYKEAISLIEKLKEKEMESDFDYNLTHRLYQLDSNAHSLYNQEQLLKIIKKLSNSKDSISFLELNNILQKETELNLTMDILKREIEILILRNQLFCKIEKDNIVLNSS